MNVVVLRPEATKEGTLLGWKRRCAIAAWIGLLALVGCGGGGNQSTPFKASDSFSQASIAVSGNGENVTGRNLTAKICSGDDWCWRNPLPQGNPLDGVRGSGASDVWAVGEAGTILHFDGSAWTS